MRLLVTLIIAAGLALRGVPLNASEMPEPSGNAAESQAPDDLPNVPFATLGGTQFWSDELLFHNWRIQRNVLTGHCRLLDDRDIRRAWGSFEQCEARLDELKQQLNLPPMQGRVVITMHGVVRSRDAMEPIGRYIDEQSDFTWINLSYASTRGTLAEHAAALARVLKRLDDVEEINFVCHSLSNVVVRRYLGEADSQSPAWQVDPRIKRIVMLAPPNQGAQLASFFENNQLIRMIWGPCCKQLGGEWDNVSQKLGTPQDFGIIAGGRSTADGINPLVDGDDDLVLSVEETRLAGAGDFAVVKRLHGQLLDDPTVHEYALRYLRHGYFISDVDRQPIAGLPREMAVGE